MRSALATLIAVALATSAAAATLPARVVVAMKSASLANAYNDETYDDGLPPPVALRTADFEAPTPATLPGATTITTKQLRDLLISERPPLVLDVLDATAWVIPGALWLKGAGHGTSFDDAIQTRLAKKLTEVTGGKPMPVVVYCLSAYCWLSINVAQRLVKLGATVLWYRGGRQAWFESGMPRMPARPQSW